MKLTKSHIDSDDDDMEFEDADIEEQQDLNQSSLQRKAPKGKFIESVVSIEEVSNETPEFKDDKR